MELKANERKVVNTQPLDYLFTQGEAGVDCIPIILPLQYGEIDLSALRWSIQLVSEQDTFISKPLSVQAGEDSLTVFWKVDEDCTAVPGRIKLTIVGISEDKTEVIKFDGREIMIKAAAYGNFAPTPDTLSAALAQAQKHEEEAAAAAKQAIQAALTATENAQMAQDAVGKGPYIGENGHWYLYDTTANLHLDSGISSYGSEGKSPYIGTDGYWYQWDQTDGIYQKTDVQAQGPKGEAGGVTSVNGILPDASGNVMISDGIFNADEIEETMARIFVSPQERDKWTRPGDLINGSLSVWQRYNADDSATYTNPSDRYVADRFRSGGTGTVQPNARGYGADIAGTITMQYWMEKADFVRMPDPVTVYYSVDGVMQNVCTDKASVPLDNNGNACIFSLTVTNALLDWVSLYPGRPVRPCAQEWVLCQRYYQKYTLSLPPVKENTTAALYAMPRIRFPEPMRVAPTATYTARDGSSGISYYSTHDNVPTVTPSGFSIIDTRTAKIVFALPSGVTISPGDFLYTNLTLDAEIYG